MPKPVTMTSPEATSRSQAAVVIGRPLIRFDQVTSTMDIAATLAALGAPEGTTVRADLQTAGRGRADRRWEADAGSALMVSIILRPQVSPPRFGSMSLLAGLAIANVAEALTTRQTTIKWPNDVLIDGRKVAGILLQSRTMGDTSPACLILGMGINVRSTPVTCTVTATSLAEMARDDVRVSDVQHRIIAELQTLYLDFTSGDLGEAWTKLGDRLAYRGQEATIIDGDRTIRGSVTGIGDLGELLLRQPDGTVRTVVSGELVRGPRPVVV